MEEFLEQIEVELPACEAMDVARTLAKVLGNISKNPGEIKYRTLKKDNRLVAEHICTSMAAVSLLLMVGFEDHGDKFVCPMCTDLEQIKAASEKLQHRTLNLDALASASLTKEDTAASSSQPEPLLDLPPALPDASMGDDLLLQLDPVPLIPEPSCALRSGDTAHATGVGAAIVVGDLLSGDLLEAPDSGTVVGAGDLSGGPIVEAGGGNLPVDLLSGDLLAVPATGAVASAGDLSGSPVEAVGSPPGGALESDAAPRDDDLLSLASDITQGTEHSGAPGKAADKKKPLTRAFKRRSDEEKQRSQVAESLEEIRRAQKNRFAEASARSDAGVEAAALGSGSRLGAEEPQEEIADLLSISPAAALEQPAEKKKDLRAFQRRKEDLKDSAEQSLQEIKRLQKERYAQFRNNPEAQTSEAYSRPPTGSCDPNNAAKSAPSSSEFDKWLSQASPSLADASQKFQQGLLETSDRIQSGLQAAGLSSLLGGSAEAAPTQAAAPQPVPSPGELPHRFLVVGRVGALVREGVEKSSSEVHTLPEGTTFIAVESTRNAEGVWRLRIEEPARGWLTFKPDLLRRIVAS